MSLFVALLAGGCGGAGQAGPGEETAVAAAKVEAEAYLFDTFIHRDGKRTSVRLELFATDSVLAAGGRAYLGKGALKGWIRGDSLKIYFPQSDEYVYEPLDDLMRSAECGDGSPDIRLLDLFFHTPDSVTLDPRIEVTGDWNDVDRPKFSLAMQNCPWQINLEYDRRKQGLRPREFRFDNGDNLQIEAKRREYRDRSSVTGAKFVLNLPQTAVQIIP